MALEGYHKGRLVHIFLVPGRLLAGRLVTANALLNQRAGQGRVGIPCADFHPGVSIKSC